MQAVICAKGVKYRRHVLDGIGRKQKGPSPIREDNMAAIMMINQSRPRGQGISTHNGLQFKSGRREETLFFSMSTRKIIQPTDLQKHLDDYYMVNAQIRQWDYMGAHILLENIRFHARKMNLETKGIQ